MCICLCVKRFVSVPLGILPIGSFPPTVVYIVVCQLVRSVYIQRWPLTSIKIPIIKIRWSHDSLIFIMQISIPGKTVFVLRPGPAGTSTLQPKLYTLWDFTLFKWVATGI